MHLRALAPIVLCGSTLWPLWAIACINSMDGDTRDFSQSFWMDLSIWLFGAVFLNYVFVFKGQNPAQPTWLRRAFFLLVGAAFTAILAVVLAGAPLLSLNATLCAAKPSVLLALVLSPAVLFALQSAFFHFPGKRLFHGRERGALLTLLVSSVLLVTGLGVARDELILPKLCKKSGVIYGSNY